MSRPEFDLIHWIRSQVRDREPVRVGIGDDAACLRPPADRDQLVAIDMLMEGVHFTFPDATPEQAGRKALAVNVSDIAAMAGEPTAAFVSVALPKHRGAQFARRVHTGVIELADEFNIVIAGGDTNSWNGPLVISVTLTGHPVGPRSICRDGAKPGDWLFVTGKLGGSLPTRHHLTFTPRLAEAKKLARMVELHAMMDISDGLAADLDHILTASRVGALLVADQIPLTEWALASTDGSSPLQHGLSDGEDFELLFAVSPEEGERLLAQWPETTPITRVGEIVEAAGCRIRYPDGRIEPLSPIGWTHSLDAEGQ
ncbi:MULTISPECIES: thiamine-monophosphate kinase [unclassified Schlesneria]|uniref:thiamine-phosphate kinase n=1 Tax=Schlesneria TaxID=656899 RepID=UPI0035A0AEA3